MTIDQDMLDEIQNALLAEGHAITGGEIRLIVERYKAGTLVGDADPWGRKRVEHVVNVHDHVSKTWKGTLETRKAQGNTREQAAADRQAKHALQAAQEAAVAQADAHAAAQLAADRAQVEKDRVATYHARLEREAAENVETEEAHRELAAARVKRRESKISHGKA